MKKNTLTKIMAIIALFWIILGVVSTWILIIYETMFPVTGSSQIENSTLNTWITK